jgi:high-affinity iron transporter
MLATALIVFREVLEASIIMGILAAATRTIRGSKRWLFGGLFAGLLGAGVVAASTDVIGSFASGIARCCSGGQCKISWAQHPRRE